jgi:hypothetical protein
MTSDERNRAVLKAIYDVCGGKSGPTIDTGPIGAKLGFSVEETSRAVSALGREGKLITGFGGMASLTPSAIDDVKDAAELEKRAKEARRGWTHIRPEAKTKTTNRDNAESQPVAPLQPEHPNTGQRNATRRFSVALSFPGEKRAFVKEVADILSNNIGKDRVLYDEYLTAELARPELDLYLGDLYRNHSELLVPFFCAEYERKKWCQLEWRQMRDILFQMEPHRVMPFRFDDTQIQGVLSTDGYAPIAERTPQQVAHLIIERLQKQPPAKMQSLEPRKMVPTQPPPIHVPNLAQKIAAINNMDRTPRGPDEIETGLSLDEERLLLAGFECPDGFTILAENLPLQERYFTTAKAGAIFAFDSVKIAMLTDSLIGKEVIKPKEGHIVVQFTKCGEAIIAEMFRTGLVRKPKYWTPEQARYLRSAFEAVRNDDRRRFLYSAIGIKANMSLTTAKEVSSQLVMRRILLDLSNDDNRAFDPTAVFLIRDHFGATTSPLHRVIPSRRSVPMPNAAAQGVKKEELERKNEELVKTYGQKPEAKQPLNPKTGLTEDEERFLIAGAELSQVFEVNEAGIEIEYSEERTQYVAANLRKKEFLDSRDGGRLAAVTIAGQRILDEMYRSGMPMHPRSWTVAQSRFLKYALNAVGARNESFLCEAIAPFAQMPIKDVEDICWALTKRNVLKIFGERFGQHSYAFTFKAFHIAAAHFGVVLPPDTPTSP